MAGPGDIALQDQLPQRGMMMTRDELFDHMLNDEYHRRGRVGYLRDLRKKGAYVDWSKRTLHAGTLRAKTMHRIDHDHPAHTHEG